MKIRRKIIEKQQIIMKERGVKIRLFAQNASSRALFTERDKKKDRARVEKPNLYINKKEFPEGRLLLARKMRSPK